MAVFLSILRVIGIVLLIILLIIAALVVIILFSPIHYQAKGSICDPDADKEQALSMDRIGQNVAGSFSFSWLCHLIAGHISYPDDPALTVRILFFHVDVGALIARLTSRNKENDKPEEKKKQEEPPKDLEGKIDAALAKLEKSFRKAEYYWNLIQKSYSQRAIAKVLQKLVVVLKKILPRRWKVSGTVGLGDPEYTAMVLEAEGMLYPVGAGHLAVVPDFEQTQLSLSGFAKGYIQIFTVLKAVLGILLDKDVRHLVHGLRHPGSKSGKNAKDTKSAKDAKSANNAKQANSSQAQEGRDHG